MCIQVVQLWTTLIDKFLNKSSTTKTVESDLPTNQTILMSPTKKKNNQTNINLEMIDSVANNTSSKAKKLIVFETKKSKDKFMIVDMEKIQNNLHQKIDQVQKRIRKKSFTIAPEESVEKTDEDQDQDDDDELKLNDEIEKNSCENPISDRKNRKSGEFNSEECSKLIKSIAVQTFEIGLMKHGYKMNIDSSFIAEGGYGSVFRVYKDGKRYACKVISNVLFQINKDRPGQMNTGKLRTRFQNEIDIMKRVSSHPNIIDFIECFHDQVSKNIDDHNDQDLSSKENQSATTDGDHNSKLCAIQSDGDDNRIVFKNFYLVMEYANSRTLSQYVKNRRLIPEPMVKNIFVQLADAIKYIHEHRIAHRDIKLSNLLLQSKSNDVSESSGKMNRRQMKNSFNYDVKLCDFGLSSIIDYDDDEEEGGGCGGTFMKPVGTSFYMAPEILRSYYFYHQKKIEYIVPYCGFKGDVWAFGVCMFYCLHGFYPLDVLRKRNRADRVEELEKIFSLTDMESKSLNSIPEDYVPMDQIFVERFRKSLRNYHSRLSFNCQQLLQRMLEIEAKKRADIFEIVEHEYLGQR